MVGRPATNEEYKEARDNSTASLLQRLKQNGVILLAPQAPQVITKSATCTSIKCLCLCNSYKTIFCFLAG